MSRPVRLCVLAAMLGCHSHEAPSNDQPPVPALFGASRAGAVADSVRTFAATVARGVTARGPTAWLDYFAEDSSFFMANEGQLPFPTGDSARRAIPTVARVIRHIELQWGDPVRVDVLGPGLAVIGAPWQEIRVDSAGRRVKEAGYFTGVVQDRGGSWSFRDVHWSVVTPPGAVP